jgi:hypothetical protein
MNDRFDQLAKGLAESVSRGQALKRFAGGIVAIALASLLPAKGAGAGHCIPSGSPCGRPGQGGCGSCCSKSFFCQISPDTGKQCFCN